MNNYQFYAERKKLPPVLTRLITGNLCMVIANLEGNVHFGALEVPEGWWAAQCRSKS